MLEAKTNLSRLIRSVESGAESEIIITRNGKAVARLVPVAAKPDVSKRLGLLEGKYPTFSLEEFNSTDDEVLKLFYGVDGAKRFLDRTCDSFIGRRP